MKSLALQNNHTLIIAVIALLLTACSDEEKPKEEAKQAVSEQSTKAPSNFDHPHGPEVTDMEKHKFEHDFAAQCVDRELNNSTNKIEDAERLTKSCECIATYMMKDLTAQEAEKFITEHEQPQSLRIKFEAAAYECLQEKSHPEGPKLFGKPQAAE
jgi:PBP1b-binding outer membrane lipoprotein LpoB